MQIDSKLIELVEEYVGSLDAFNHIETISLYHDLSIYGDDASELLLKYSEQFNVSMNDFCFETYFPEEGDPILNVIIDFLLKKRKEYRYFTIGDLQNGIRNKKIQ